MTQAADKPTNLAELIQTFTDLGIKFTQLAKTDQVKINKHQIQGASGWEWAYSTVVYSTILVVGEGCGISGYHMNFYFDKDGKYLDSGIYQ